jgi:hypothetical protein
MRENLIKKIEDLIEIPLPDHCKKWVREYDNRSHNTRDLAREIHESIKVRGRGLRKDIELILKDEIKKEKR